MLLDRSVLEKEPLMAFKIFHPFSNIYKCKQYRKKASEKRDGNCNFFGPDSRECSERLLESQWAMLKGYRKATRKCQRLLDSLWEILEGIRSHLKIPK
jgi:hypothetical protein